MVIVHVMGGLGNQLCQYALSEKLKTLGKTVKLDTYEYTTQDENYKEWRELELEWLEALDYEVCTSEERMAFLYNDMAFLSRVRRKLLGRKDKSLYEKNFYMPEILEVDDRCLNGYWVCDAYYADIMPMLRSKIRFPISDDVRNQECMKQMQQEESVSLHIRRTDYLSVAGGERCMGICTQEYYQSAIRYMEQRLQNPVFYIFSDDSDYAREHYKGENIRIVDWNTGKNSMYDMQLMSQCKHNICANSTFSIWGARLNAFPDKIMIRPLHLDNYEAMSEQEIKNGWKNWILIDETGSVI